MTRGLEGFQLRRRNRATFAFRVSSSNETHPNEPGVVGLPEFVVYSVSIFSLICRFFHFICHPTAQTSIFAALNAFNSMKFRRGSTSSPISIVNT